MRRGRIFFYLAFILILALVAVLVLGRDYIFKQATPEETVQEQAAAASKIIVVSQTIRRGTVLEEGMLGTLPWQEDAITAVMFREGSLTELYGRRIKYDLELGTPLLNNMLMGADEELALEGSPWALSITKGMVAVSVPVNRLSSVSYAPRPGDRVDVIVTLLLVDLDTEFQTVLPDLTGMVTGSGPPDPETGTHDPLVVSVEPNTVGRVEIDPILGQAIYLLPSEPQRPRMVSQRLLQDVMVLQMGNFPVTGGLQQPAQTEEAAAAAPEEQAQQAVVPPDVVTLIVSPQDAVTLNYLIFSGAQLTLALRRTNDDTRTDISPVTLQYLMGTYNIPQPVKLPYGINPRIDILVPPTLENDKTP